jgi:putative membrane protein
MSRYVRAYSLASGASAQLFARLPREERRMDESQPRSGEVRKETAQIQRSAEAVEDVAVSLTADADRRTVLATDRTYLASERTYAAWMRTALAALASGIGARAVMHDILPGIAAKVIASILVLFAALCVIAAVWRQLQGVSPPPHPDIRPIPNAVLIPTNAVLMLVVIAALIGIWAA